MELVAIARRLRSDVSRLKFAAPVAYVYDPLVYAWKPHRAYLERYGRGRPRVILLGMNPGPFGMAQTGVPFGDVGMVRGWLGIEGPVGRPAREHPKRPVAGFHCPRGEVSGQRLWGWARDKFVTPQRFFERFFVANYCPLAFIEASGRNRTPDKLPRTEQAALYKACDTALRRTVERLRPEHVVGVGRFAADRAAAALKGSGIRFGVMPHPSPASPAANRGWAAQATRALADLGIAL
ncbi:MAG TPA: uracil-DNA glycosylase family protein [Burkholderiales bacterium]|nr:uracil-DNA glycosylase family protein [Burkholderiales bacterium]